ncbi:MAG: hypothetical protein ACM3JJ_11125 [Hyphomicrobiales bacterium]
MSDPLSDLVRAEAARVAASSRIRPDPERLAAGWERRFTIEARRAEEYVRLYEEAGFEVAADPVRPEQVEDDCGDCRVILALEYRTVYTRRRGERGGPPAGDRAPEGRP